MKKIKLIIGVLILIVGMLVMISGLFNKKEQEVVIEQTTIGNKTQTSNTTTQESTTTTTTTTTTKKVVKTTKKITKAATFKNVATASKQEYMAYARQFSGYNDTQMQCLDYLWSHESGWNPNDYNEYTDCCGIPQSHPCNKIYNQQKSYDWQAQIRWGINYISNRYGGNPCSAWNHYKNQGGY